MQGYDPRLYKMASEKGWKLPATNNPFPAHSWNNYWAQCEEYERNPESGRPVVPHRVPNNQATQAACPLDRSVRQIFCCGCGCDVDARLTDGAEIYPHRDDLTGLPFWKCDKCGNFVGCHHKTKNPTEPLGCIPTQELKDARKKLHALIDPIWQSGRMSRSELYEAISREIGWSYHTAKTRTIEEARAAYKAAAKYA